MPRMKLVSYVICLAVAGAIQGAEPGAETDAPFWQLPPTKLDLGKLGAAEIKLIAGPDTRRRLIVLQTGLEAPPVDFVPINAELQPFIPAKDSGYEIIAKGLNVGAMPFGDRKYKIEKLPPEFKDLTLLQTKMGHKAIVDSTYSIVVNAAKPCLVFLALDQRVFDIYSQHGTPGWLKEYTPTGQQIKTDDPIMAQTDAVFQVYVRQSAGGRIVLGPPAMDLQFNAMYFAFFGERAQ